MKSRRRLGLPSLAEWQALLGRARHGGRLVAVEPDHYPRHFRALAGFHRELSRLRQQPITSPLEWGRARQYLAAYPAGEVAFG